jgi:hypothetical protein
VDTSSLNHRCGRPNKAEELEIENKIYPYFIKCLGPETVSQLTGYNIKTVRRYYKKFKARIISEKEKDYVKEWHIQKNIARIGLEQQLAEQYELQASLKKQFKAYEDNGEEVHSWMYKERRKISESIRDMILSTANFALLPTADVTLENQTREVLQEHGLA